MDLPAYLAVWQFSSLRVFTYLPVSQLTCLPLFLRTCLTVYLSDRRVTTDEVMEKGEQGRSH